MQKKPACWGFTIRVNCKYPTLFLITLFFLTVTNVYSQGRKVTGIVKDAAGVVLQGVSVTVKGNTAGTSTDAAGHYSINVPAVNNATLVFSFVGYTDKEEMVGSQTTINVALTAGSSS